MTLIYSNHKISHLLTRNGIRDIIYNTQVEILSLKRVIKELTTTLKGEKGMDYYLFRLGKKGSGLLG